MTETDADTIPFLFIRTLHSMGVDLRDGRDMYSTIDLSTIHTIPIFVVIAVVVKCNNCFV